MISCDREAQQNPTLARRGRRTGDAAIMGRNPSSRL